MSNHNSETVMLSGPNLKGTIIEPRRTLTFPIPAHMQDWNRIRFGIAISYTDLVDPEATLGPQTEDHTAADNTEATWPWFGLTSNSSGELPLKFGADDIYVGTGQTTTSRMRGGVFYNGSSKLVLAAAAPTLLTTLVSLKGGSILHHPNVSFMFVPFNNGDPKEGTHARVYCLDAQLLDRGESTQRILLQGNLNHNTPSQIQEIDFSEFNELSFVSTVNAASVVGGTADIHSSGVPEQIPQNIIFNWPFYNIWRARLHGAVLVKVA